MVKRTYALGLLCALTLTSSALAQELGAGEPTTSDSSTEATQDAAPAATSTTTSTTPNTAPSNTALSNTAPAATTRTAAPPPSAPPATPSSASATEDEAPAESDEDDDDSYGVMYIRLQGGLSYANLLTFNQDNFIPEAEESNGVGPFGGLGVGFRVYWFSIGANATFGRQGGFNLGTVGAELAFHIPIPIVQPYVRLAAGYAWAGRYDFQNRELAETDIYGLTIEAGAGVDIKLLRHLSIGLGLDAAFLNLTRQELGMTNIAGVNIEETGDALGFQLRAHAHLTIHI